MATQKRAHERYQNLSEVKKVKEEGYGHERCKSFPEDGKQRLIEYTKKCDKIWKNKNAWHIKTG